MNVLLSEEEQSKSRSHSTAGQVPKTVGTSSSTVAGGGGRGGATRQSIAAEADVLFTTNTGKNICVHTWTLSCLCCINIG